MDHIGIEMGKNAATLGDLVLRASETGQFITGQAGVVAERLSESIEHGRAVLAKTTYKS